jgi:hypothetical protein
MNDHNVQGIRLDPDARLYRLLFRPSPAQLILFNLGLVFITILVFRDGPRKFPETTPTHLIEIQPLGALLIVCYIAFRSIVWLILLKFDRLRRHQAYKQSMQRAALDMRGLKLGSDGEFILDADLTFRPAAPPGLGFGIPWTLLAAYEQMEPGCGSTVTVAHIAANIALWLITYGYILFVLFHGLEMAGQLVLRVIAPQLDAQQATETVYTLRCLASLVLMVVLLGRNRYHDRAKN